MSGRTIGGVYKNVIIPIDEILKKLGYDTIFKASTNTYIVEKGDKVRYFELFGGEGNYAFRTIQGRTFGGFFFDELTLHNIEFFNMAVTRCSVENAKWWATTNPDSPYHWVKKEYIDMMLEKNILVLKFTLFDNPALPQSVKDMYARMYTGVFRMRYIEGKWVSAEGLVYDGFSEENNVFGSHLTGYNLIQSLQINSINIACDYGTTNPCVFLLCGKSGINKYVLDEYCWDSKITKRNKTDGEYADDMEMFFLKNQIGKNTEIIIDPSAKSFITELNKRGFMTKQADNSVLNGIRETSKNVHSGQLKVNKTCENVIKEFTLYAWDDKKSAKGEDAPIKEYDHAMDALRYWIWTTENMYLGDITAGKRI